MIKNNNKIICNWKDDKHINYCIIEYPDNSKYYGDCNDNFIKEGFGIMHYPDGSQYYGDWDNDKRNGYGVIISPNKDYYSGYWKDDVIYGSYVFYDYLSSCGMRFTLANNEILQYGIYYY